MADSGVERQNQTLANQQIFKSLRDLLTVKVTLPLGNPNYKLIHTNSFIKLDLSGYMDLENFNVIAKAMSSLYSRWTKYEEGRWYVEAVNITEDNSKGTIELELNPFPSSLRGYQEALAEFRNAYMNYNKDGNSSNSSTTSTGNSTLKGGQGEVIDNLVRNICGNITDELERCKAIHEWLRNNVIYKDYECSWYHTPENCYNHRNGINCADTAILTCSMMLSAGLNAYIVHRPYNGGHFWTLIEINGKTYASDQTGRESAGMSGSPFNSVWSRSGRANTSITDYGHKENGLNTC